MITILQNGIEKQFTSKVANVKVLHDLMRCYAIELYCASNNPIVPYINKNCQVKAEGQLYDVVEYQKNAGIENNVFLRGHHIGYRLNNYKLLIPHYSHVGTRREIAEDILLNCVDVNGKRAFEEFSIGTCDFDNTVVSFELNNENEVTARFAILALKEIGIENEIDNLTINFKKQIGNYTKENPLRLELGKNLSKVNTTWSAESGESFTVNICDTKDMNFSVGDYVEFDTDLAGSTEIKRIMSYTRYLDDPTKNSIVVGNFVRNMDVVFLEMEWDIQKSIQMGKEYNNCSINHADGFVAKAEVDGKQVVTKINATQGPSIIVDGKKTWGVTPNGRTFTQSISNLEDSSWYAEMGVTGTGEQQGLTLTSATTPKYLQITENAGSTLFLDKNGTIRITLGINGTILTDQNGKNRFYADNTDTMLLFGNKGIGIDAHGVYKLENNIATYF